MGQVIHLDERRNARRARAAARTAAAPVEFLFDLACPFTYLAAERVERAFADVLWTPASGAAMRPAGGAESLAARRHWRRLAEDRAAALRLPLIWPERWPAPTPSAMRVANHASVEGRGGAFVLAATRLAFCGGFDLEDPETLAEAAAAAGLGLGECLGAAADRSRDARIAAAGDRLLAGGADRLPALRVGAAVFSGEERIAEAAAAARLHAATAGRS